MKTPYRILGVLLLALLLGLSANLLMAQGTEPTTAPQAPLGTAFTYQGELRRSGAAISDTCQMAFRLYDDAAAGSQVGAAITQPVTVSGGRFTVGLDFGAGAFDGQARWLDIRVQCPPDTGFTGLGRQALTAAPYSAYALASGSAAALQGRPVSGTAPGPAQVLKWNGSAWAPGRRRDRGGRHRRYHCCVARRRADRRRRQR